MRINEYTLVTGRFFDQELRGIKWRPAATRRPRLTLRHLSKLRKQRELRKVEKLRRKKNLPNIYQDPDTDRKSKRK